MSDRVRLLDVNFLIALSVDSHVHHAAAHAALAGFQDGWATCPITEAALLRLLLNPLTTGQCLTGVDAMAVLVGIRAQPAWRFIADRSSLAEPDINTATLAGTKQVTDFHLLNVAAANGSVLATFDTRIPAALSDADRRHVEVVRVTRVTVRIDLHRIDPGGRAGRSAGRGSVGACSSGTREP